jgi:hypothetical protein
MVGHGPFLGPFIPAREVFSVLSAAHCGTAARIVCGDYGAAIIESRSAKRGGIER